MKFESEVTITCNRPEFMDIFLNGFKKKFPEFETIDVASINVKQIFEEDKRGHQKRNDFIISVYKRLEKDWFKEQLIKYGVPNANELPDKHTS